MYSGNYDLIQAWQKFSQNSDEPDPSRPFVEGYYFGFEQCGYDLADYIDFLNNVIGELAQEYDELLSYIEGGGQPLIKQLECGKRAYLIT